MFHKNLVINGVKYPLAVNITGSGAPTESTEATTGMFYMDEDTGDVYKRTPDGWVKNDDFNKITTIRSYEGFTEFYQAFKAYVETSRPTISVGTLVKVENSNIPLLYVSGIYPNLADSEFPYDEQEVINILESEGRLVSGGIVLRKYSEILGGDFGDVENALDSIIAIQNALMGGDNT